METAIVVPLTGAVPNPVTGTPVDLDLVFGRLVDAGAQSAEGMPFHVTLLTPFVNDALMTGGMLDRLQDVLSKWPPFGCKLEQVRMFAGPPRIAWLEPEPTHPFIDMTRTLIAAFPGYRPYGGEFGTEIVPHVTIAAEGDPQSFERILDDVRASLPIHARAEEFSVYRLVGELWKLHASRPLGDAPR